MKNNTKKLVINAMLCAMCAILGSYLSIDLGMLKFTFESFPILLSAYIFGPISGLAVGVIGTLVSQMARYGLDGTTVFWILPYAVCGLVFGFLPKKNKMIYLSIFISQLLVTVINSFSLYYLYGSGSFATIPTKLVVMVVKSVLFAWALPIIKKKIEKFV